MRTIRVKVDGEWSELMTEEMFLQDQRGLEIEGVLINEQLTPEECAKRWPEQFARFQEKDTNSP